MQTPALPPDPTPAPEPELTLEQIRAASAAEADRLTRDMPEGLRVFEWPRRFEATMARLARETAPPPAPVEPLELECSQDDPNYVTEMLARARGKSLR